MTRLEIIDQMFKIYMEMVNLTQKYAGSLEKGVAENFRGYISLPLDESYQQLPLKFTDLVGAITTKLLKLRNENKEMFDDSLEKIYNQISNYIQDCTESYRDLATTIYENHNRIR